MPAWDNKERSALNVSSFKVFEHPLELTNRGEVNNGETERGVETMKRGGGENGGAQPLHKLYVLLCLYSCICLDL